MGTLRSLGRRHRELRDAGVNVSISTNNIVNPFTPYGHPDLLRQALITAMAAHLGNLDQLAWLPELFTTNPARALGLPGERAIEVTSVESHTPAAVAGLKSGDLIVAIDGRPVDTVDDVHRLLGSEAIGRPMKIELVRDGRRREVSATPREAP